MTTDTALPGRARILTNRRNELLAQITWAARELGIVGRELDALTREQTETKETISK